MAELIGYLLTMDAIFTWALASLVYKWGLGKTKPKASLLFRLLCVTIGTFFFALIFGNISLLNGQSMQTIFNYFIACAISGLSVTLGDLLFYFALRKIDVSRAYPLSQLSLIFVYPFAFILFGEVVTLSILIGGLLILLSVFILSTKDKEISEDNENSKTSHSKENLFIGVLLSVITAFCWGVAIVSFNQARIIINDVFVTNFFRVFYALIALTIVSLIKTEFLESFKKENRKILKFYFYIAIAGILSLGLADTLFYKAAEINGLVLTSTITVNTPMVQQIFSILILKEKFRKRFLLAVALIIIGNYIILFF
ncbi:MAG: DMT family transporter [Promethearchaeota archaeon]